MRARPDSLLQLTNLTDCRNREMKKYSTVEAAKLVGVSRDTLHRWIREKRVAVPPAESFGAFRVRLWSEADIERLKKYKAERFWGKGGRKVTGKKRK